MIGYTSKQTNKDNYFYIIKLFAHKYIYLSYSWPNGWTEWANIFRGNTWVTRGFFKSVFLFSKFDFKNSTGNAEVIQLVIYIYSYLFRHCRMAPRAKAQTRNYSRFHPIHERAISHIWIVKLLRIVASKVNKIFT